MIAFVKTYPRAVVRIARPTTAKPEWGPMWRIWTYDHNGNLTLDGKGNPIEYSCTPRKAALDSAEFDIGLIRQVRRAAAAWRGGRA